jgi:Phage portal protein
MAPKLVDRLYHAWNAFNDREATEQGTVFSGFGESYSPRPDRIRTIGKNERSIVTSLYARMSIDVASIDIRHVKLDANERYVETVQSGLNNCLTLEANIDQGARHFKQALAWMLFDKGVLAVVPIDTSLNPKLTGAFDINTMRIGEILRWYPRHVRVSVYNDRTGLLEELVLPKDMVAIIENPLYEVMNQPNSTLQRLIRKLNILDAVDEASSSGKLDLIIQLPYVIKSDARRQQAEERRQAIEMQLKGSTYGIAYTDGTEKITQLNRPTENNLLSQIEFLTNMLFGQLGLTKSIFDGTASEAEMLNYHNRTIEPILAAITQAMKRRFLTKTARTQMHSIEFFRDPFKLVPVSAIAEIADKFTRNEIASANEIRSIVGWKPHGDPKADKLENSNMPVSKRGGLDDSEGVATDSLM